MANFKKRVPENAPGDFFVDSTCIDCDACRQIAPAVFGAAAETSFVKAQPSSSSDRRQTLRALLSCPTGSIGCLGDDDVKGVMQDFPLHVEEPVFYCGYNSPKSYGGNSYFVRHPRGNWLVDSPKFLPHLVKQFEAMGGLSYIFLTHQDDVADAAKFANHFRAARIIHRHDVQAQRDAEIILDTTAPVEFESGFRIIPTPGHTQGHCVMLYDERFLFTGDHLWWEPEAKRLGASRSACWYSWPAQIASMRRLLDQPFEWLLPGHGDRCHLPAAVMLNQIASLVDRMCS